MTRVSSNISKHNFEGFFCKNARRTDKLSETKNVFWGINISEVIGFRVEKASAVKTGSKLRVSTLQLAAEVCAGEPYRVKLSPWPSF